MFLWNSIVFSMIQRKYIEVLSSCTVEACCCCEVASVMSDDAIDSSHQAPPSLGFSRQEHWSGLPFPSVHVFQLILHIHFYSCYCFRSFTFLENMFFSYHIEYFNVFAP